MTSDPLFSNAEAYERYVGRWSRLVAQQFVAWLDSPPHCVWLDVGAGTGVLTQVILEDASPAQVIGMDVSPEYIRFARDRIHDQRVELRVGDATNLAFETPQFDIAVAGLVLNFVPSPEQMVRNMAQVVRQDGTVAAYVWDYSGEMQMMRHFWDAATHVDPSAQEADAGQRFTICRPENLRALFESLHLAAVALVSLDIPTRFKDFDDYWLPFLGAQGSVSRYLAGLDEKTRAALRDQLQQQLPVEKDGSISLMARAWAIKGTSGSDR